jgi:hypothetical protein
MQPLLLLLALARPAPACLPAKEPAGCKDPRLRQDIRRLGPSGHRLLVQAMEAVVAEGRFQAVAAFHGFPGDICGSWARPAGCCPHESLAFLPWHRLLTLRMEEELGLPLPYWDWTVDPNLPDIFEHIRSPIKDGRRSLVTPWHLENGFLADGSRAACPETDARFTRRSPGVQMPTAILKLWVRNAFLTDNFADFSWFILQPHNLLHGTIECDMWTTETSAYDPLFYLHHSYVDRQFAFWQELQRLRGREPEDIPEHKVPLRPFNISQVNTEPKTLQNSRGEDTYNYRRRFCYDYDDLTFDGLSPGEFLAANRDLAAPPRDVWVEEVNRLWWAREAEKEKTGPHPASIKLEQTNLLLDLLINVQRQ